MGEEFRFRFELGLGFLVLTKWIFRENSMIEVAIVEGAYKYSRVLGNLWFRVHCSNLPVSSLPECIALSYVISMRSKWS